MIVIGKFCDGQASLEIARDLEKSFGNNVSPYYCDFLKESLKGILTAFDAEETNDHAKNIKKLLRRARRKHATLKGARLKRGKFMSKLSAVCQANSGGNCAHHSKKKDPESTILIWDTGASHGVTLHWSDFIDYVECEICLQGVTHVNRCRGIGTTLHKFRDENGEEVFLTCVSYRRK